MPSSNLECQYSYMGKLGKPKGSRNKKTLERLAATAPRADDRSANCHPESAMSLQGVSDIDMYSSMHSSHGFSDDAMQQLFSPASQSHSRSHSSIYLENTGLTHHEAFALPAQGTQMDGAFLAVGAMISSTSMEDSDHTEQHAWSMSDHSPLSATDRRQAGHPHQLPSGVSASFPELDNSVVNNDSTYRTATRDRGFHHPKRLDVDLSLGRYRPPSPNQPSNDLDMTMTNSPSVASSITAVPSCWRAATSLHKDHQHSTNNHPETKSKNNGTCQCLKQLTDHLCHLNDIERKLQQDPIRLDTTLSETDATIDCGENALDCHHCRLDSKVILLIMTLLQTVLNWVTVEYKQQPLAGSSHDHHHHHMMRRSKPSSSSSSSPSSQGATMTTKRLPPVTVGSWKIPNPDAQLVVLLLTNRVLTGADAVVSTLRLRMDEISLKASKQGNSMRNCYKYMDAEVLQQALQRLTGSLRELEEVVSAGEPKR
ncbi:hypothetical protein QBC40DRAFT_254172 [Triangularia verruculosa]|uniref:Uncharacterized protein n=1 Tax=Triangularia verruculosa TaxID=2587418 RepID=A0AAN6XMC4_9PEZI|nr:hypothetical protein QBC40DRAFT_254172 [Triangularia verruculosa]